MNIIICIDDNVGILFNNRRQSKDAALVERIIEVTKYNRLLMNEYSSKLFSSYNVYVDNSFLKKADKNDYCFVENLDYTNYLSDINKVIIYKWNRAYPYDVKADLSVLCNKMLISSSDFTGNSHEIITEEIYE